MLPRYARINLLKYNKPIDLYRGFDLFWPSCVLRSEAKCYILPKPLVCEGISTQCALADNIHTFPFVCVRLCFTRYRAVAKRFSQ